MPTLLYQQSIMKLTAMGGGMKVHQFSRGFISWEQQHEPSLSLNVCKRLRPLLPKKSTATNSVDSTDSSSVTITTTTSSGIPFDLKSFIKQDYGLSKTDIPATDKNKVQLTQVETHPGGTRWNPTQEQIGILEMLYRGGMRTPNAQRIEQITKQLSRHGKIEGKSVFYWFQNHKARERQKQKRNNLGLISHSPRRNSTSFSTITLSTREDEEIEESSPFKKKCRTLELFPLHPEGR